MDRERLGPYEILEPLGAGGMGEVYLAQDTRLGRRVAVKVLPGEFADDPERLARFEQEARAAASLNHPHIAAVFDVGASDGTHYMVQELLEGRSLRDAMSAGALPRARALTLAAEIAEGLAAAHEAGIVHRDLKPENVFVTPSGHVKILDFGLAKLADPAVASGGSGAGSETRSPTMIGTMAGAVMGSAGYMAPEQVAGEAVDRRTDVFALGCVLYEMVTGERAFAGETLVDTLHAITRSEPERMRDDDADIDADLRWLLEKCLAKNPAERYQHADDLAVDLRRLLAGAGPGASGESVVESTRPRASLLPWALAAVAVLLAGIMAGIMWLGSPPELAPEPVSLTLPAHLPSNAGSRYFALSPDGRTAAYLRETDGISRLVLRGLDTFEERPVVNSEGAIGPFFSPDGRQLGFFARSQLWTVDVAGGSPRPICDVSQTNSNGIWAEDGTIWFVSWATELGLMRVPPGSEAAEEVSPRVAGDSIGYMRPRLLPDGSGVAVQVGLGLSAGFSRIFLFDGSPPIRISRPQVTYRPDGDAFFLEAGRLFRARYDPDSWAIVGESTALASDVVDYAVAPSGTLIYRAGLEALDARLVRRDRSGGGGLIGQTDAERPAISPDGRTIALDSLSADAEAIELWSTDTGNRRVLEPRGLYVQWAPDASALYFQGRDGETATIVRFSLDGSDEVETLLTPELTPWTTDVSPDGSLLLYYEIHPETERDIWVLPLDGGEPFPWLVTPASERSAVFSPDGRWIAYMSEAGGTQQIYVRPAPGNPGGPPVVILGAGREPRWSPDGSEIFFRRDDGLWAAPVDVTDGFAVGAPELLFRGRFVREEGGMNQQYDVFPNGDFLTLETPDAIEELRVVTDWLSTLGR